MIPYGRQTISDEDIAAVTAVLRSDFLTQGPVVPRFEEAVAAKVGARFAVAVNSATSALHLACLALGVGHGDVVWTVPNSFVASANCALYCEADVDFVDIDPHTYNMDVQALAAKCAEAASRGQLPKVVIPVHFAGQPCDMAAIGALAKQYGFKIIEDASHAIGASYQGNAIGDCRHSDVVVFSFHPVKIITTAEGGLALCNDAKLASKLALLRSHGVTRDSQLMTGTSDGPWYYEQVDLGLNYRMTEMQAALGLSQLPHLDAWVSRRHHIASCYHSELSDLPVMRPVQRQDRHSALHLYPIQVDNRRQVFEALRAAGIGVNVHYIPIHTQPFYQARGFRPGQFPVSEAYYSRAISLPLYSAMTDTQQDQVLSALRGALQ